MTNNPNNFYLHTMEKLFDLAETRLGVTGNNPTVAACVVKNGTMIAEGVHHHEGGDHAEVLALKAAGSDAHGSDLFVTLEPCTHYGKTPPCVQAIISSGVKRVIYAIDDPNPMVRKSGGAKRILESHNIEVISGVCETDAYRLNAPFFHRMKHGTPFISVKIAQTHDGYIPLAGKHGARIISSEESLKRIHRLRRQVDAIITGIQTVISDTPSFDVRYQLLEDGFSHPSIVILDPQLRTPLNASFFRTAPHVILLVDSAYQKSPKVTPYLSKAECVFLDTKKGKFSYNSVLEVLSNKAFLHCMFEAGPTTLSWLKEEALINRIYYAVTPHTSLENCIKSPYDWRMEETHVKTEILGNDLWLCCDNVAH